MKTLLSIFAASGLVLSTAAAYAECGHQSAKINQVTASDTTAPASEEVVASTYDPQTIKKPVEASKEQVTQ
jgi:peptide methionine sulfoxide reductase MsrA